MTPILMIRHGPTDWNRRGRIQGHTQTSILPASRAALARCRLPPGCYRWEVFVSPLRRTRQSARALRLRGVRSSRALAEMRWGEWEGRSIAGLRAELGDAMTANEARGLDFRPPGGESPRRVRARLRHWLVRRARIGRPLVAITHKGVIRAALSLATGWNLRGPSPVRLDWACAHGFEINRQGRVYLRAPNIDLRRPRPRIRRRLRGSRRD